MTDLAHEIERQHPHNREAERSVIGGLLRDPDIITKIAAEVQAADFYFDAHQKAYQTITDLHHEGKPIDLVLLFEHLKSKRQLEDVGGITYLTELWEAVPTGANAEYHARVVRDHAARRAMLRVADYIRRDADGSVSVEDLLSQSQRFIADIAADAAGVSDRARIAREFLKDELQRIDDRASRGGEIEGVLTGLHDLDEVLGGLNPGQMFVIGARPSVGKTALGLGLAANFVKQKVPSLFFSLEMPESEMAKRLLALGSGVAMNRISRGELSATEIHKLSSTTTEGSLGGAKLWLDDTPSQSAAQLIATCNRLVHRHGIRAVVVDYLGLIRPENPRDTKTNQVGLTALRVKEMARSCGVTVILLAQLNRQVENRTDGRPMLADLRDSGEIEQHADIVAFIHQFPDQGMEQEVWRAEILVRKNRNGPTGDVEVRFRRPVMRFESALI